MRPAMKLTRKLIGLQWRERSSLSNIFELIDDGLDCLGLHCAFVKLQPVQWPGVHLPRWESGRFQWSRSDYAPIPVGLPATVPHVPASAGPDVAKHMRGDIFQPPRQVYERLAACDVSLTLYLSAQVLCGASPKLSHRSLRHPLRDSYPDGLPFRRHRNSDQKPFSLLVTTKSRQSLWAAHELKIAAQQTRSIKMQRNTTRFACL